MAGVKVNIITGPLSSGKSTAILSLLARKPEAEKWAVLVNESGDVGIDGASFEQEHGSVTVREIAGGCVCCANGVVFRTALTQLIARTKPSRVLVEPSGLGEASRLVEMVRAMGVGVGAVVTLVPADAHSDLWRESNGHYRDQVVAADVLVVNRTDVAADGGAGAQAFARDVFPPKVIAIAERGRFDLALLDAAADPNRVLPPDDDDGRSPADDNAARVAAPALSVKFDRGDGLVRFDRCNDGRSLVGYLVSWPLDEKRLLDGFQRLSRTPLDRAKAIIPVAGAARLVNWRGDGAPPERATIRSPDGLAANKKNRIQLIFRDPGDSTAASSSSGGEPSSTVPTTSSYTADVAAYSADFELLLEDCRAPALV